MEPETCTVAFWVQFAATGNAPDTAAQYVQFGAASGIPPARLDEALAETFPGAADLADFLRVDARQLRSYLLQMPRAPARQSMLRERGRERAGGDAAARVTEI